MDSSPTIELIIADMKDWLYEVYEDEYCQDVIRAASDHVIIGTVSDIHDKGIMGFCDMWYGTRWGLNAYGTVLEHSVSC